MAFLTGGTQLAILYRESSISTVSCLFVHFKGKLLLLPDKHIHICSLPMAVNSLAGDPDS